MKRNMVIAQHLGSGVKFLFFVPGYHEVRAGEYLLCDTKRGQDQIAIALCDSFHTNPEPLYPLFGTEEKKMKYVTARLLRYTFDVPGRETPVAESEPWPDGAIMPEETAHEDGQSF